jgi:formylglycine-generating enzyme
MFNMDTTQNYQEGDTLKDTDGNDFKLFDLDYTQMAFVAAKGKTFTMGDNNLDHENEKETNITFDQDYYIGRFAVTQALYAKVMGSNPAEFKGDNRPVETVSWNDITNDFLPKLNQIVQKQGIKGRFALPSEAQWEYAAAGGQVWDKPKLEYAGANNPHDVGWFTNNSADKSTFPVGLKEPNALGLYDMSGNVWEWCQDDYQTNLTDLPKNGLTTPNQKDANKMLRGGGFLNGRIVCRVRYRDGNPPDIRYDGCGFRLVFFPLSSDPKRIYEA